MMWRLVVTALVSAGFCTFGQADEKLLPAVNGQVTGVEMKVSVDPETLVPEAADRPVRATLHLTTVDASFWPDKVEGKQVVTQASPQEVLHFSKTVLPQAPLADSNGQLVADVPIEMTLDSSAHAQNYSVQLAFAKGGVSDGEISFDLPIGAQDGSMLHIVPPAKITVYPGDEQTLDLQIANGYREYPVKIYGASIRCESRIVNQQDFDSKKPSDPILEIPAGATRNLQLKVKGNALHAIGNTSSDPQIAVRLYYSDGTRSIVQTASDIDVKVSLAYDWWWTLFSAIFGGLIGSTFRILLPAVESGPVRSRLIVGILAAIIGYVLSIGLGIQLIALGDRSIASYTTIFGSIGLGILVSIMQPAKLVSGLEAKLGGAH